MEDTRNNIESTKQANEARELQAKLSDEIKEATRAMERTMRWQRLVITEPLRHRYREII